MEKKRFALRMGDPHEASDVERVVESYGRIELSTITELMELLTKHTDYGFHMELIVNVGAVNKTIDNEHDARITIKNLKAKSSPTPSKQT